MGKGRCQPVLLLWQWSHASLQVSLIQENPVHLTGVRNYRQWNIWTWLPTKCLESWCLVDGGGSPVTTLFSPAALNCSSVCCGGLAPWSCSLTTRVILIVMGEEFCTAIWLDCWLCSGSSSSHSVLLFTSVPKVNHLLLIRTPVSDLKILWV